VKNRLPLVNREQLLKEAREGAGHRATSTEQREHLKGSFLTIDKVDGLPDRAIRIRITTGARDRQGDTIAPAGWDLSNYLKNPVVLYGHNYFGYPVAKDIGLTLDGNGLVGTPLFTTKEENPEGDMCYRMITGGFLNTASVGFAPQEWTYNEVEHGIDFLKQELLEYSIVPIPANPEALVEARSAGIDLAPMKEWAEQVLELDQGPGLWLPKSQVEHALKLITPRKIAVPKSITDGDLAAISGELAKSLGLSVTLERTAEPDPAAPAAVEPITDPSPHQDGSSEPSPAPAGAAGEAVGAVDDELPVEDPPADKGLRFTMDEPQVDPLFDLLEEPALKTAGDFLPDGITAEAITAAIREGAQEVLGKHLTALTGRLD
jgi:HK97 family phage prohead protease